MSAKNDWKTLFGAVRAAYADVPEGQSYVHSDVAAVNGACGAVATGCRAGFALRHARKAAQCAPLAWHETPRSGRFLDMQEARRRGWDDDLPTAEMPPIRSAA